MEQPIRSTLNPQEVYLVFDSHYIYIYVGHQTDSHYVQELFEVENISSVAMNRTEEQIFSAERLGASVFLNNLYSLINSVRY